MAKFGIALEWGSRGLEFESRHSDQKSSEICGFRNFFCAFCGTLESEEKVVHNATITAVKKVRKLGFEKVTFCNFFGERFFTHAEFLWPVAP